MALVVLAIALAASPGAEALVDDFERDFWLPFTHVSLGDRAEAGYATDVVKSGGRSYRVAIHGWSSRDHGSAYGYALYATDGVPIRDVGVSMFYRALEDTAPSPWDAFAAGISLQLLDTSYRSLGTYRYLTAVRPSLNGGRCGPSAADIVIERAPALHSWKDVGRSPAADFPGAPWEATAFVRVAIGFLCAAGLTGAAYALYFDDFSLNLDMGDSDGDGLEDLVERTRLHLLEVAEGAAPLSFTGEGNATAEIDAPMLSGVVSAAGIRSEIDHPRAQDLSLSVARFDGTTWAQTLLWDPGFHVRGLGILSPTQGAGVQGTVAVSGGVSWAVPTERLRLLVDGVPEAEVDLRSDLTFAIPWDTDRSTEGVHEIRVIALEPGLPAGAGVPSTPKRLFVDRTAPELELVQPRDGASVSGLLVIEARAYDAHAIERVELWVDGVRVDVRDVEPYTFVYDTLDLTNEAHSLEVRAYDPTGNSAVREARILVSNALQASPPPPCLPACTLDRGAGIMTPTAAAEGEMERTVPLANGDRLRITEGSTIDWRAGVAWGEGHVSVTADLLRSEDVPESDGLVATGLHPSDVAGVVAWRVTVRDHGRWLSGSVRTVEVLLAAQTSPGSADTDGDGLTDRAETDTRTSPVLLDTDDDLLSDPIELNPLEIELAIEGIPELRTVATNPLDGDVDDDRLGDGSELAPPDGDSTDPTDPDTDGDGLSDGRERLDIGSRPTRRDTDGDSYGDGYELLPRVLSLQVSGSLRDFEVTTSPILWDTDDDRIGDPEEEFGSNSRAIATHPALADTDEDGLNDSEELRIGTDGLETDPLHEDTDHDGVWDAFDRLAIAAAEITWYTEHPTGLIRFDQAMQVFWLRGLHANVTKKLLDGPGGCFFIKDDVAAATESSVVSPETISAAVNKMFADGGETKYRAVDVREGDPTQRYTTIFEKTVGTCGEGVLEAAEYHIEYEIHQDEYVASFVNREPVTISDEEGTPFSFGYTTLPVAPERSVSVVVQFSLVPEDDRSSFTNANNWLEPSFTYVVYGGFDFAVAPILTGGTVFATPLNENAYRVELRVPGRLLTTAALSTSEGEPLISLYFSPQWTGRRLGNALKLALNGTSMSVASISMEGPASVHSLFVRLDSERQDDFVALSDSLVGEHTGYHTVAGATWYVFRAQDGESFDPGALSSVEAILLVAESEPDLFGIRDAVEWGPVGQWYRAKEDAWGTAVKVYRDSYRIVKQAVAVSHFAHLVLYKFVDPGSYLFASDPDYLVFVEKGQSGGTAVFVVTRTRTDHLLRIDVLDSETVVVRKMTFNRLTQSEIVTDLRDSRLIAGHYARLKPTLQALGAGAVLITTGREAVIAFSEGEVVKGAVYGSNTALGLLGLFKGEKPLGSIISFGGERLRALRLGAVATAAAGAFLAGYELHLALSADEELSRRWHFDRSIGFGIDTGISLIPVFGIAVTFTWGITTLGLSLLMPNPLAAQIASSPGTSILFLANWALTGDVPPELAKPILEEVVQLLVSQVIALNSVFHIPAVPILP